MPVAHHPESFTHRFARWAGSGYGFLVAVLTILIWVIAGYVVAFTSRWAEAFSIYIEIITFLMIFLMQRSQNKDTAALQIKLNELISASQHADNKLINVEERSEKEISIVQDEHRKIGEEP